MTFFYYLRTLQDTPAGILYSIVLYVSDTLHTLPMNIESSPWVIRGLILVVRWNFFSVARDSSHLIKSYLLKKRNTDILLPTNKFNHAQPCSSVTTSMKNFWEYQFRGIDK